MKRALLSVANKDGVVDFARGLEKLGYELVATESTLKVLKEAGLSAVSAKQLTSFPDVLGGKLESMHPSIHAAIQPNHSSAQLQLLRELGIEPVDLVAANVIPVQTLAGDGKSDPDQVFGSIDTAGLALISSAAMSFHTVKVVVKPEHYHWVLDQLVNRGHIGRRHRYNLAIEAVNHIAEYNVMLSRYMAASIEKIEEEEWIPPVMPIIEEPDPPAPEPEEPPALVMQVDEPDPKDLYDPTVSARKVLAESRLLNGSALNKEDTRDTEEAWNTVKGFEEAAVAIVRDSEVLATATGEKIDEAFGAAIASNSDGVYGSVIALNRVINMDTAQKLASYSMSVILAPGYDPAALEIIKANPGTRILEPRFWRVGGKGSGLGLVQSLKRLRGK